MDERSGEDALSTAQRHAIEAEQHVTELKRIVEEMHPKQAEMARRVLQILEESLRLARVHLARELETAAFQRKP